MGKRFTDSGKFSDKWFRRLTPLHKLGWDYLYHACDAAGVVELDEEYAAFLIGSDIDWQGLRDAAGDRIQVLPNGRWWLTGFIQFQYGRLSPDCKPHVPVISLLAKHGIQLDDVRQAGQFKFGHISSQKRRDVFARDKNVCCYCGDHFDSHDLEADHATPKTRGGNSSLSNLVAACVPCNREKSDATAEEYAASLPNERDIIVRLQERLPERVFDTLKEKEKDKDKDKEKNKGGAGGKPRKQLTDNEFELWWELVPKKTAKGNAATAYTKAVEKLTARGQPDPCGFLADRMAEFAKSDKGRGEYCPHPATWLNGERYDDDPATWQDRRVSQDKPKSNTQRLAELLNQ